MCSAFPKQSIVKEAKPKTKLFNHLKMGVSSNRGALRNVWQDVCVVAATCVPEKKRKCVRNFSFFFFFIYNQRYQLLVLKSAF